LFPPKLIPTFIKMYADVSLHEPILANINMKLKT